MARYEVEIRVVETFHRERVKHVRGTETVHAADPEEAVRIARRQAGLKELFWGYSYDFRVKGG